MIILEKPYVSPELLRYLAESRVPVLDNETARASSDAGSLHLVGEKEFAEGVNHGSRVYTTSENALTWVMRNIKNTELLAAIDTMKDKFRMRETLRPLYLDFFFRQGTLDDLRRIDPDILPMPLILKPAVGFFSVGVHVVSSADEWRNALDDIEAERGAWRHEYPDTVVGDDRFLVEEYVDGDEYAVDAYYNKIGDAVVLNIFKHDFSSSRDVADRLYCTSPEIINAHLRRFTAYLNRIGKILDLRNFPVHAELRMSARGIVPIEFNPLRFAGWCCTDLAWFAYGLSPYQYYLEDLRPDWKRLLEGRENNIYSLVILDKPASTPKNATLDFDALAGNFTEVLSQRRMEDPDLPVFGFLFTRTPGDSRKELERAVREDLARYLRTE